MGWFSSTPRDPSPLESVRASAKAALSTFVSERLARYPQNESFFELGLARLVAGQMACETGLKFMVESPSDYRSLLDAISSSPYRGMQRMFCAFQHMALHSECLVDFEQRKSWLYLVGEGACDMYSQPFSTLEQLHVCYMEKMRDTHTTQYSALCARSMNCAIDLLCNDLQCQPPHIVYVMSLYNLIESATADFLESLEDPRVTRNILQRAWA
jgi:hypothetical protein